MAQELYVGLNSGTSMDSIDAVLVDLSVRPPRVVAAESIPWQPTLRERLQSAAYGGFLTADQFAMLDAEIGVAFGEAANAAIPPGLRDQVKAIGSHGQTLAHAPQRSPGYTLQLGDPSRIAEITGITTVANMRGRDVAAGGEGAPLAPAFHHACFAEPDRFLVMVNIGGISNITCLPGDSADAAFGFDTGPGNCLMDGWCRRQMGLAYDRDGALAARGSADPDLLRAMKTDAYFSARAPKSTGTDYFSGTWLTTHLSGYSLSDQDILATLLALTAETIAEAILGAAERVDEVLVCGGGVHNKALMARLNQSMPCPVTSIGRLGLAPDWVEGALFAWLARQALQGLPGNLPRVTGAAGPRILGAIYPA